MSHRTVASPAPIIQHTDPYSIREIPAAATAFGISADEIEALDRTQTPFEIIGQPRATRALEMAIRIEAKGYNIFVVGLPGTGKRTAIRKILSKHPRAPEKLRDVVYVHNFANPTEPRVLYFEPGAGRVFRAAMRELVSKVTTHLQMVYENVQFKTRRDELLMRTEGDESRLLSEFESKLDTEGFALIELDGEEAQRTDIAPVVDGETTSFDALQKRVHAGEIQESHWKKIRERYYHFVDEMNSIFHKLRLDREETESALKELQIAIVRPEIEREIESVRQRFPDTRTEKHLSAVLEEILANLEQFLPEEQEKHDQPYTARFDVNIVVDNAETSGSPIVFESHPDYAKLFGSQEVMMDHGGEPRSTFMMLRAGSLVKASGGFLVLRGEDIFGVDDLWNGLKRALLDGQIEIRNTPGPFNVPGPSLKPEPIEIDVKVIVTGSDAMYDLLFTMDEEFQKLFKVPAEFDSLMPRTENTTREYISFIRMITADENLLSFSYDGIARIVEYGVRLSEFRDRLSTQFSYIADLIREADYWARLDGKYEVTRAEIERALSERKFLYNLPEEKIDEQILSGELLVSVRDSAIGRINGLAILDRGFYSFARPILITARAAPGTDGIVNIERESGLSGEIHDKGVYIIEGYLQSKYARDFPLSVRASVCFEQSYVEVDGDSASSTEIYVLLSAIAEIPLRQDIAVTGSVNQMGEIQPVGGINEKIEGFYEICRKAGITGTQGVIIPRQNLPNLVLSADLQQALTRDEFHIYAVETIDEGMEILTSLVAGERTQKGRFKIGTVNSFVEKRLREMAQQIKDFGGN
ncbi:MAG: ATP-binding protein [Spirochaetaceae bacterium]|nr:MAG: ATP-binding protein [Spirochaetaceae bacterium]